MWGDCGIKRETRAAFLELWVGIFYYTEHDILFTVQYILYTVQLTGYNVNCNIKHLHFTLHTVKTDQWCQFVRSPAPTLPHNSALHIPGIQDRTLHQNTLCWTVHARCVQFGLFCHRTRKLSYLSMAIKFSHYGVFCTVSCME